jgi:hypothetical protein
MPKMPGGPARGPERLGDQPIEEAYREKMNAIANILDDALNGGAKGDDRQVGFCLMMFNFGDGPGRANYISNARRADVVTLLREQLRRFEGAPDVEGRA